MAAGSVPALVQPCLAGARVGCLLAAFAASLGLRVAIGGPAVAQSTLASLVFAGWVHAAAGTRVPVSRSALRTGLLGGLLSAPVGLAHLVALRPLHGTAGFACGQSRSPWSPARRGVPRGTGYDAVAGPAVALGVAAVAIALLHVPLYGWSVLPLDLAVGVVLGLLRSWSGTAAAPAVTHVDADLVGWFVR